MMVDKYNHRRLGAAEFSALLNRSKLTVDDFLYLTGRRRMQLERFLKGDGRDYTPTMAEVMILELAVTAATTGLDDDWIITQMFNIARRYDAGPRQHVGKGGTK